jgi:preprotein translocase subunit YajC
MHLKMTWDTLTLVLAQETQSAAPAAPDNTQSGNTVESVGADGAQTPIGTGDGTGNGPPPSPMGSLWIWMLPLALVFIMISMGGRKEKKKHAKLMAALSKGDKVRTAGGILGTVVEVRDDEIVVKVDENANTRLRFSRTAIQTILESKNAD